MKITLTITRKDSNKATLFGSRINYLRMNFGNSTNITIEKVEFDDEYKEKIGDAPDDYFHYSAFLMDCCKYDFRVISINGKRPKFPVKDTEPIEYIERDLNPYNETYDVELPEISNTIEVDLKLINDSN